MPGARDIKNLVGETAASFGNIVDADFESIAHRTGQRTGQAAEVLAALAASAAAGEIAEWMDLGWDGTWDPSWGPEYREGFGPAGAENYVPKPNKPYANSRPSYGKNQIEDVWGDHVNPQTGTAPDPSDAEIIWDRTKPRNGQWDMGHNPGQKYTDVHAKYWNGEMTLEEFLEWYRNPKNYRPELPSTNRGHRFE